MADLKISLNLTYNILGYHMKSCVIEKIKNDDDSVVDELLKTIKKMVKLI